MRGTRARLTGTVALTAALALLPAAAATATATTTTTSSPTCTASTVRVTADLLQPAAGSDAIAVHLTATAPCVASGYPGAALVDARGDAVAYDRREPRGYFGGIPLGSPTTPPRIEFRPGQQATALVEFGTHAPPDGAACPVWPALRVTLPRTIQSFTFPLRFSACADGFSANPLLPGATGSE